ncbi:MAG: hypothetical protein NVS3B5_17030 [Sphingomicrobium sp.]
MIAENLAARGLAATADNTETGGVALMGGYGSGRLSGRSAVEDGLTINLGLMFRQGWIRDGAARNGTLTWSSKGEPFTTISHRYDLTDPDNAYLTLIYARTLRVGSPKKVEQRIRLT